MKKLLTFLWLIFTVASQPVAHADALNYDQLILFDAEDLAETGIKEAYARILPSLRKYVVEPVDIKEIVDSAAPTYAVLAAGVRYDIYSPKISENVSWGRATFALFDIVNRQLKNTPYKFYAFNGGNDLGGMFLTADQHKEAIKSIKKKSDLPYIPTQKGPWYGQAH